MSSVFFWIMFPLYAVLAAIDVLANRISGFEDGRVRMRHVSSPTSFESDEHLESLQRDHRSQALRTVATESAGCSL